MNPALKQPPALCLTAMLAGGIHAPCWCSPLTSLYRSIVNQGHAAFRRVFWWLARRHRGGDAELEHFHWCFAWKLITLQMNKMATFITKKKKRGTWRSNKHFTQQNLFYFPSGCPARQSAAASYDVRSTAEPAPVRATESFLSFKIWQRKKKTTTKQKKR